MVGLHLYVEGGGDSKALHARCREGFRRFLEQAGLQGHMPRIVACGSRNNAYDDFKTALAQGCLAMLLVDSEAPVTADGKPWAHLAARDAWEMPKGANDSHCHLMVQVMESWLLADRATLQAFFGQGFKAAALPAETQPIETIPKAEVFQSLANATKDCKTKARYGKGEHSFELLGRVDPAKVTAASPWAHRFVGDLKKAMNA
ncbi:MAG: DUF4276 family protein [Polaromonas sp.]